MTDKVPGTERPRRIGIDDQALPLTEGEAEVTPLICEAGTSDGIQPAVSVRPAGAADSAPLARFAARAFAEAFAADNRPEDLALHLSENYTENLQRREILDPEIDTLLAEVGSALVGYAQLNCGPLPDCVAGAQALEIRRCYVSSSWHGRGVAQALMRALEAAARRRGARQLWLGVWERNARAQAFYRKCGFTTVGSHTFIVGSDRQRDCVMTRRIDDGAPRPDRNGD